LQRTPEISSEAGNKEKNLRRKAGAVDFSMISLCPLPTEEEQAPPIQVFISPAECLQIVLFPSFNDLLRRLLAIADAAASIVRLSLTCSIARLRLARSIAELSSDKLLSKP